MNTNGGSEPLTNTAETKEEEQLHIYKKQRFKLLDEIHSKQQALDRLDYKIHAMKNNQESGKIK